MFNDSKMINSTVLIIVTTGLSSSVVHAAPDLGAAGNFLLLLFGIHFIVTMLLILSVPSFLNIQFSSVIVKLGVLIITLFGGPLIAKLISNFLPSVGTNIYYFIIWPVSTLAVFGAVTSLCRIFRFTISKEDS